MLRFALLLALCSALASCETQKLAETERLRNTPPALSSADEIPAASDSEIQPRFLPFSASFSVAAGGNNAQTFSIAGSPTGIGVSQSASHSTGPPVNGNPGAFSSSQSSSLAAGLNGISAAESNSFASNHPHYGPHSQANGNSFALGQAAASSHGDVINGQAISNAQSSAGGAHTQASSGASATQNLIQLRPERPGWGYSQPGYANGYDGDYYYNSHRPSNNRPQLHVTVTDDRHQFANRPTGGWYDTPDREPWRNPDYCNYYNGWYRDPRCRNPRVTVTKPGYYNPNNRPGYHGNQGPYYENIRDPRQQQPGVHISSATAGSSAHSGPGGFAVGQSSSHANHGSRGPSTSSTTNHAQSSGNAQAQAHGTSGSVHFNNQQSNKLQASISSASASASANSRPGGSSQSNSQSSTSAGSSNSHSNTATSGSASAHASAQAGSTVVFPGPSQHHQSQIIPQEFVRSKKIKKEKDDDDPFDELLTDITDTVYDIFDV